MNKCNYSNKYSSFLHDMAVITSCTHTTTAFLIILERTPTLNVTSTFYTFEITFLLLFWWNQWTSFAVHSIRIVPWFFLTSKNIGVKHWFRFGWHFKIYSEIFKVLLPKYILQTISHIIWPYKLINWSLFYLFVKI